MRRALLQRSVQQLVGEGATVTAAAYGWTRHRLMMPYAAGAFVALVVVAAATGYDEWPVRLALGAAGAAISVAATTSYWVVAATTRGVVLCRASRFRQVAVEIADSWPTLDVELVGGTPLTNDWEVAGRRISVTRSSERAMHDIARST